MFSISYHVTLLCFLERKASHWDSEGHSSSCLCFTQCRLQRTSCVGWLKICYSHPHPDEEPVSCLLWILFLWTIYWLRNILIEFHRNAAFPSIVMNTTIRPLNQKIYTASCKMLKEDRISTPFTIPPCNYPWLSLTCTPSEGACLECYIQYLLPALPLNHVILTTPPLA